MRIHLCVEIEIPESQADDPKALLQKAANITQEKSCEMETLLSGHLTEFDLRVSS